MYVDKTLQLFPWKKHDDAVRYVVQPHVYQLPSQVTGIVCYLETQSLKDVRTLSHYTIRSTAAT